MELRGVFTALVTPFNRVGSLGEGGLRKLIDSQLKGGVSGVVPCGTTGESPTLPHAEHDRVIEITIEHVAKRVPVIAGTGSNATAEAVRLSTHAVEAGADALLLVNPYYNKPTQMGLFRHFKTIADAVTVPCILYNIKGRTGTNIETGTLDILSQFPNIVGVKEASGDIRQIGDVIERIQNRRSGFSVMSGDDAMTLPLLALGGRGVVSVVSNLVPDRVTALAQAALAGDFVTARERHFELLPLFKAAFIESNPIPIKAAMNMCGLPAGGHRLPLCKLKPENRDKLRHVLLEMGLLKQVSKIAVVGNS